jgi:hypothetical protein
MAIRESYILGHSLLDDALIGIEDEAGTRHTVTLPGLLARLSSNEPIELTALQAHQQHAWHAFTVQLAALALSRAENSHALAHDEAAWRALLADAAKKDGAGTEAFTLVVGDLSKPAFMQPPVPEGTLAVLKNEHTRPPVARKDGKALTMSENGFTYERVQDLMFGDWAPGAAAATNATDSYWVGQVLVRGQGKTGGYHERWVPVSGKARSFFATPDARAKLGKS